jgi:hypothetical protein
VLREAYLTKACTAAMRGDYTARGHKLRFSVIPACFWRESSSPISVTHQQEAWMPDRSVRA